MVKYFDVQYKGESKVIPCYNGVSQARIIAKRWSIKFEELIKHIMEDMNKAIKFQMDNPDRDIDEEVISGSIDMWLDADRSQDWCKQVIKAGYNYNNSVCPYSDNEMDYLLDENPKLQGAVCEYILESLGFKLDLPEEGVDANEKKEVASQLAGSN